MYDLWLVLLPLVAGGLAGLLVFRVCTRGIRRALRDVEYELADHHERLVREVKKRAAQDRWERGEPGPTEVQDLEQSLRKELLPPDEFIRRKQRLIYGSREVPGPSG